MTFTNLQVALSDLPRFENIELTNLDPSYARLVVGVVLLVEGLFAVAGISAWWLLEIPQEIRDRVVRRWSEYGL